MEQNASNEIRRPVENKNGWYFALSVFFALCLALGVLLVIRVRGVAPHTIPLFDALLAALAAFRITRLVVYDKIMRFAREWFMDKRYEEREGERFVTLTPARNGLRAALHELMNCPWCIGFWASFLVLLTYYLFAWGWFVVLFLAVAGAASFVQVTANFIGWKAEYAKRTTQREFE